MATINRTRALRALNTVLSLGMNLLIERFGLDPRLKYLVWGLIAANEIRGIYVVWLIGDAAISAAPFEAILSIHKFGDVS